MYSKIAFKNVKKSFKDYTIYFLTLTLAVCIFYSFNSIEAQKALLEMGSSTADYAEILTKIISYVSIFVAVILGSLILYSNNFLIKKRNKELGIYMTLGMGKSRISRILILETIIVGTLSLVSGLIVGFGVSQGLSILISKLFEVSMSEYSFVISTAAIGKTIVYFGIMFLLVILFNTYVISKYKIIDLLTVGRKIEEIKFKNPFVYFIAFILCVISLGVAYNIILKVGLNIYNPKFIISIILGIIGTVLFFFSLAGFILYVVKKSKKIYFKGLNIFIVKQINSKINTNFISMSVICLMLFITIGVLSTGLSFKNSIDSGLKGATPYDASAGIYFFEENENISIENTLNNLGLKFSGNDKVAYFNEYDNGTKVVDTIPLGGNSKDSKTKISYIKVSEYNKIKSLNNEEQVILGNDEVLITSNVSKVVPYIKEYLVSNNSIKIGDETFKIKNSKLIEENMKSYYYENNWMTLIVNDDVVKGMKKYTSNVNINFDENNKEASEKNFNESLKLLSEENIDYENFAFVTGTTRTSIYEGNKGLTTTILFVGLYLGVVFLISSMAVLALQQLSEASDSIDRYSSIKKLGASKKDINKTIFIQTLIYFTIPVILALFHSVVGIQVANEFLAMYKKPDIFLPSLVTAGIFILVYGVYFYTTYTGYKSIVKNKI